MSKYMLSHQKLTIIFFIFFYETTWLRWKSQMMTEALGFGPSSRRKSQAPYATVGRDTFSFWTKENKKSWKALVSGAYSQSSYINAIALKGIKSRKSMCASAQRQADISNIEQVLSDQISWSTFRIKFGSTVATNPPLNRKLFDVVKCGRWSSFFIVSGVAIIAEFSVFVNKEREKKWSLVFMTWLLW